MKLIDNMMELDQTITIWEMLFGTPERTANTLEDLVLNDPNHYKDIEFLIDLKLRELGIEEG